MNPDVTVLVPVHRGARKDWLNEAIASVGKQAKVLILENDGELAQALNNGLTAAGTEFVFRLDYDDLIADDTIELLHVAAWDADVVYPKMVFVNEDLQAIGEYEADDFCPNRLLIQNYISGGSLIRREAALKVGGYRPLDALEDWDLWVRMSRAGCGFKANPLATYYYRQVPGSRNKLPPEKKKELTHEIVGEEHTLHATWYAQEGVGTTYWRCTLPARHLPGQVVRSDPREVEMEGDTFRFPLHRGAAIWQFPGHQYERFWMAAMQEQGIRVLLETDDNYTLTIPHSKLWRRGMPVADGEDLPSIELHRRVCQWVDGITVTTEHLAKQYRKITDAPVYVVPNQIDPADWPDPKLIEEQKEGKTWVGVAASASHLRDMKLLGRALEWAAKQPDVEVVLMGLLPKSFKDRFPFRHFPWTGDLSAYRKLQGLLDIGLAPIVENPWSVSRSDLKVLEYAMAGAFPIVSDSIPYRDWKGTMVPLAREPRDWEREVRWAIKNPDERKARLDELRTHVLKERTVAANIERWKEAIEID